MIAQVIDLTAIFFLGAALAAAVVVGWRRQDLLVALLRSPLFAVFLALLACHPFALDWRWSAWRLFQWLGYLAIYLVAQATPRRLIEVMAGGIIVGATVAVVAETAVTGRGGALVQQNPNIAAALILQWSWLSPWPSWALIPLVFTGCRGAIISYAAALGGMMGRALGRLLPLLIIVGLTLALALARPSTVRKRLATWVEAGRLFLARPLVGWGPGCYPLLAHADPDRPHADSLPLTIAVETGLVGLAAWGWLAVWAARAARHSEDPVRWALVAFAAHNVVDNTIIWYWPGIATMVALAIVEER